MSSAHQQIFIKDLVLIDGAQVSGGIPGQGYAVGQDLYDANGNKLGSVQLTSTDPDGNPNFAYTQTLVMLPKYNDYMLTALCTGCSVTAILEHSPDGINWCDCVLSDGSDCEVFCQPLTSECTVKIVDVPLLQYVRVKVQQAANDTLNCTIMLTHTMNY